MSKILIVEDDKRIGTLVKEYFIRAGFNVDLEEDGLEGYVKFSSQEYVLIILDVMLPGMDGFEIAKRVRKISKIPIIMLTARTSDEDQLRGYEFKVDDYMTKPFNPEILVAKAKNLLERVGYETFNEEEGFNIEGFHMDFLKRKVYVDEKEIQLEPKQYDILKYLVHNQGRVKSREEILDRIWGYDYFGSDRVVDTQIRKLRKNLKHKAYLIKTAFSVGYSFEEE